MPVVCIAESQQSSLRTARYNVYIMSEQEHAPRSSLPEQMDAWMQRSFEVIQRLLIAAVGIALVVLSVMALWDTVVLVHNELQANDITLAITVGVDTVFLTIILLELLHTVMSRGPLARQAPDFIIIGITSAIRHGLGLVASSTGSSETVVRRIAGHNYTIVGPGSSNPRDLVISLAINSLSVLLLVGALWLVRHRFGDEGVEMKGDSALPPNVSAQDV